MNASTRFGDMTRSLAKAGFPLRDLLPLIPPAATLTENSVVKEHQIGKIPGRYFANSGKWSGLSGTWPTFGLNEADQEASRSWPTHNVGLRAADFPGIDCDTDSPEALRMVEDLIAMRFGDDLPVRERGGAPRALYPFRRIGDAAIRKHRIEFTCKQGKKHAVEVLGLGQQYVVSGIHTSGVAYEWRERQSGNGDLIAYEASGLPQIDADGVGRFMAALRDEIIARGWTVTSIHAPKFGAGGRGEGILVNTAEPLIDPKIALSALRAIPNRDARVVDGQAMPATLPRREDLIAILSAFKASVGKEADNLFDEVAEWAQASEKRGYCEIDYLRPIWDSITTARVSPDHLLYTARKYGWRGDAAIDFAEFGEEDGQRAELSVDKKIERAQADNGSKFEALTALAGHIVYVPQDQVFIDMKSGTEYSAEALNNSSLGTAVAPAGTTGQKSTANRLRNEGALREVKGMVYLPGKPPLTQWEREGRTGIFYNRWHSAAVALPDKVTDAEVKLWLDHVSYLIAEPKEREQFLNFMAHVVQKRGEKIRWAPLVIGKQGTGKDLMIKPLLLYFAHNARDVKPEQLTARFNSFLENELLVVQEMKRTQKTSQIYNQIKTLIAGTATDENWVEHKFKNPYAVPNLINSIFFSNHFDCIDIEEDDRRFMVVMSDAEKRDSAYYNQLAEVFYRQQSGWRKVIRWLMQRDLTNFDASKPPTMTEGKTAMIEGQRSELFLTIQRELDTGRWKDRQGITAAEIFDDVKQDHNVAISMDVRRGVKNPNTVAAELGRLGWKRLATPVRVEGEILRFWTRPGTEPSLDKLRDEYKKKEAANADF